MRQMTNELRSKIKNYIKSGIDISDLIQDVEIKNENLSYAVISKFDRSNQDISGCKLLAAKIPNANLMRTKAVKVCFDHADMSNANCRYLEACGSSFLRTNCMNVDFCGADLRSCNFCDMTITFSNRLLYKTKVSSNILNLLDAAWVIDSSTTHQLSQSR